MSYPRVDVVPEKNGVFALVYAEHEPTGGICAVGSFSFKRPPASMVRMVTDRHEDQQVLITGGGG